MATVFGGKVLNARAPNPAMRFARAGALVRYLKFLESEGVCTDRLLASAGIPNMLLDHPKAVVPEHNAFRFIELGCQALGTEHVGVHLLRRTTLKDFGSYGRMLENALTVYEYLRRGTSYYNALTTGQQAWLSDEGGEIRLNVKTFPDCGLGAYQTHLSTLLVTLINIRKADSNWVPREMGLAYRSRETLPETGFCWGLRLSWDTRVSYITIPRDLLGLRLSSYGRGLSSYAQPATGVQPIPVDFSGLVEHQIESLMSDATLHIDTLAESLSIGRRNLQRKLAKQGLNFSQMLARVRFRLAADWLEKTDKTITDIAFDLGYTDASNFTRAFRWQAGVPPQHFRNVNRSPVMASR